MRSTTWRPDYVVVGHIARDVAPGGYVPGGTALYATLTARRLGVETGVLTSVLPGFDPAVLEGAHVSVVPTAEATIFENTYGPDGRIQILRGRAAPLTAADVPEAWRSAPIVHLGPIADEVDPAIAALFPHALRAATPQGWLRHWGADGRVWPLPYGRAVERLRGLDVVVLSEEDVAAHGGAPALDAVHAYLRHVPIVVLTRGARGATVYAGHGALHVPAFAAHEVDPTGAGDVFAAAFLVQYRQDKDLLGAARFAAAVAAFAVEGAGPSAIPTRAQALARVVS